MTEDALTARPCAILAHTFCYRLLFIAWLSAAHWHQPSGELCFGRWGSVLNVETECHPQ